MTMVGNLRVKNNGDG